MILSVGSGWGMASRMEIRRWLMLGMAVAVVEVAAVLEKTSTTLSMVRHRQQQEPPAAAAVVAVVVVVGIVDGVKI